MKEVADRKQRERDQQKADARKERDPQKAELGQGGGATDNRLFVSAPDIIPANLTPDVSLTPDDRLKTPSDIIQTSSSPSSVAPDDRLKLPAQHSSPDFRNNAVMYMLTDGSSAHARFVRGQNLAQDGHTSSEHQVYQALWRAGGNEDNEMGYRDVTIGQTAIARQASISKRNLIRILDSLHDKFSIETLQLQVSSDHTAKTYRVWSMKEILNRRRARGYSWIYRNRNVVALAKPSNTSPGVSLAGGGDVSLSPAPGVSLAPPLGSSLGSKKELSSSTIEEAHRDSDDASPIAEAARRFVAFDADAVRKVRTDCRKHELNATDEEIAHLILLKCREWAHSRKRFAAGLIIESIPKLCEGGGELKRYREGKAEEARQIEAEARQREAHIAELIADHERILADPAASEEARISAREYLAILKTGIGESSPTSSLEYGAQPVNKRKSQNGSP